jgi:hypothetical protein
MYTPPSTGASFQHDLNPSHHSAGQRELQRNDNQKMRTDMDNRQINLSHDSVRSDQMTTRQRDTNVLQQYDRHDMRRHSPHKRQDDDSDEFGKADLLLQKASTSLKQRQKHTSMGTYGRNTNPFSTGISHTTPPLISPKQDDIATIRQIVQEVVNESLIANMTNMPTESSNQNKSRQIKIQPFSGHTSLETFLAHFQLASDYNKWSPSDQLMHLKLNLTGTASNILWDVTPDKTDSRKTEGCIDCPIWHSRLRGALSSRITHSKTPTKRNTARIIK